VGGLCEGASILSLSCRSRTLIRARAAASLRFSFKPACHLTSLSHPQFHALPAGWLAYYTANILSLSCRLLCRPAISCPALPTMNSNGMGTKVNCPRTYLPHPPMSDSIAIYSANAFVVASASDPIGIYSANAFAFVVHQFILTCMVATCMRVL